MKHNSEQKVEDNFRLPVFWQTPCCTFALLLGHLQCGSVSNRRVLPVRWRKAGSLAGWLLCSWLCVPANVLALWRWRLETSNCVRPS